MNKLLSCRFNMDTNRVEARFEDSITLAIDCIAMEDEYGSTPGHSGQSWTGCSTTSHWSMHSLCWVEGWSITYHWDLTTVDWKIDFLKSRCHLSTNRIYYKQESGRHSAGVADT